jgi:SNF2 family DNA or RNA helicase
VPQYPGQQTAIIQPPPGGEFANLDIVQARPGEIIGDWDELITDIKATAEEVAEDYNEEDTIVPGFDEKIKLRPWQVQGRHWMLARETEGKRGGILADDVSCLLIPQAAC